MRECDPCRHDRLAETRHVRPRREQVARRGRRPEHQRNIRPGAANRHAPVERRRWPLDQIGIDRRCPDIDWRSAAQRCFGRYPIVGCHRHQEFGWPQLRLCGAIGTENGIHRRAVRSQIADKPMPYFVLCQAEVSRVARQMVRRFGGHVPGHERHVRRNGWCRGVERVTGESTVINDRSVGVQLGAGESGDLHKAPYRHGLSAAPVALSNAQVAGDVPTAGCRFILARDPQASAAALRDRLVKQPASSGRRHQRCHF